MHTTTMTTKFFPIRNGQLHESYDAIDFSPIMCAKTEELPEVPLNGLTYSFLPLPPIVGLSSIQSALLNGASADFLHASPNHLKQRLHHFFLQWEFYPMVVFLILSFLSHITSKHPSISSTLLDLVNNITFYLPKIWYDVPKILKWVACGMYEIITSKTQLLWILPNLHSTYFIATQVKAMRFQGLLSPYLYLAINFLSQTKIMIKYYFPCLNPQQCIM